jgi:hypothetical protein
LLSIPKLFLSSQPRVHSILKPCLLFLLLKNDLKILKPCLLLKPGPVTDGVFIRREEVTIRYHSRRKWWHQNHLKILTSLISETLLSHGIPNSQWLATFHEEHEACFMVLDIDCYLVRCFSCFCKSIFSIKIIKTFLFYLNIHI